MPTYGSYRGITAKGIGVIGACPGQYCHQPMCYGCYEEAGKPAILNSKVKAAASLISAIYEYSCVGSNAHVVVDDWNYDDRNILHCLEWSLLENIHEATGGQLLIERAALNALLRLSIDERVSALALHEGFLSD